MSQDDINPLVMIDRKDLAALQAQVERLTADLNDSNDKRQALEIGIRNLSDSRNNLEQEAATLKRENAELKKRLGIQ